MKYKLIRLNNPEIIIDDTKDEIIIHKDGSRKKINPFDLLDYHNYSFSIVNSSSERSYRSNDIIKVTEIN